MKVTILKENLSKGLNIVGRIISTRGSLEVLSNVLIKTKKGRVSLSATNLEIGINYLIGAKVEKEGAITVPARLFTDFVSSLPGEKVTLELVGDTLHATSDNYNSNIKGISAAEFPLIPEIKDNKIMSVNAGVIREAINLVNFAAAADDARPVLSGIYLRIGEGKLILAATDGYRLAEKLIDLKDKKAKKIEAIVPARTLAELARILGDFQDEIEVSVYISENQVLFKTDGLDFTSRLIEGQFPNYKQIIPETNETTAKISREEFLNSVRVAILFARENANSIKINVRHKGKIEVASQGTQLGDNSTTIVAEVEGKDSEIAFNGKYLIDVLSVIKESEINFQISGKLNPGVIRTIKSKNYIYIIMPLRA